MWTYKLERIKDSPQWPRGVVIYAHHPCKGWRIIDKFWDYCPGSGLR